MGESLKTIPPISVEIKGNPLDPGGALLPVSVRIQKRLSVPSVCEILFSVSDSLQINRNLLSPGNDLKLSIEEYREPLFNGQITAVEDIFEPSNNRFLRVRGYDKIYHLKKRQKVRVFPEVTLGDLIDELVKDLSIKVQPLTDTHLYETIVQFEQTDLELICEIAQKHGLYFTLRNNNLSLFTLEGFGDSVSLELGENLLELKLESNVNKKCDSVMTTGWNVSRVETFQGEVQNASGGIETGTENQTNAERTFQKIITDENLYDELEAQAISQSEFDRRTGTEMNFWGVAEGDPAIHPGTPVEISGLDPALDGNFVASSVNHVIDVEKGFISEISSTLPKYSKPVRNAFATIGIITKLNDPEGFGRGRAKLPNFENIETGWLQIVASGAGVGKGLVALPDVEDTVLILFPRGNITQGIILGGLYGMMQAEDWDWGISDGRTTRYRLQTPGNQTVLLNDDTQTLKLENSDGSFVEMSPEKVIFLSKQDLEIRAPGRAVLIEGQSIDFEQS